MSPPSDDGVLGQVVRRLEYLESRLDFMAEDLTEIRERLSRWEERTEQRLVWGAETFQRHSQRLEAVEEVVLLVKQLYALHQNDLVRKNYTWRRVSIVVGIFAVLATWIGLASQAFGWW